jgi:hypothetical protein
MSRILLAFALAFALVGAAPARALGILDAPLSYSATRTVTVDGRTYTGAMFHEPGHERHDQVLLGMQGFFILDDAQSSGVFVMPALKTMIEFPFPPILGTLIGPDLKKIPLGDETIDGVATTKYRVTQTAADGTRGEGFLWISRRGVLMKLTGTVTAPGGHRTTVAMALSGMKEGPQQADLFTPPAGLTRLPAAALTPLLGGASAP